MHAGKHLAGARLSRFARALARSAGRKRNRCALPGCGRQARALRCCRKALCPHCRAQTLRATFGRRLVCRCPFCRRAALPSAAALKRMMAVACPSHATVVESEGGPPSVVAHLPCLEGLYRSAESKVLVLSIAQERLVDALGQQLDKERAANAHLSQQLGRVKSRVAAVSPEGKD